MLLRIYANAARMSIKKCVFTHFVIAEWVTVTQIHERIRQIRKSSYLTQAQFAERLGVTRGHISKIETGPAVPSASLIDHICKEFWVSIAWLRDGKGSVRPGVEDLEELYGEIGDKREFDYQLKGSYIGEDIQAELERAIWKAKSRFREVIRNFVLTYNQIIAQYSKKITESDYDIRKLFPHGLEAEGARLLYELFSIESLNEDPYIQLLKAILPHWPKGPITDPDSPRNAD